MVATAEKVGKVARIGGWEGVWVIRAMPEFKRFKHFYGFPKWSTLLSRIQSVHPVHPVQSTYSFSTVQGSSG